MKSNLQNKMHPQGAAFTLVEMLVVIAIIAIVASIIIPVLGRSQTKAKVAATRAAMAGLQTAIKSYHDDYDRWPAPPNPTRNIGKDITYGDVLTDWYRNEALMEILMAVDNKEANGTSRGFNKNHGRNPQKNRYIDPSESGQADGFPGLSMYDPLFTDPGSMSGRYHDPFGNEFIISVDFNGDGLCVDDFYGRAEVSGDVYGVGNPEKPPNNWPVKNDPKRDGFAGQQDCSKLCTHESQREKQHSPYSRISTTGLKRKWINGDWRYGLQGQVMIWTAGPNRLQHPDVPGFGLQNIDRNGNDGNYGFGPDGYFSDTKKYPLLSTDTKADLMFWSWSDNILEMKYDANKDGNYALNWDYENKGYHCGPCESVDLKHPSMEHGIDANNDGKLDFDDAVNDDNILSWR